MSSNIIKIKRFKRTNLKNCSKNIVNHLRSDVKIERLREVYNCLLKRYVKDPMGNRKRLFHEKKLMKIKNLSKGLLIELIFMNIKLLNINNQQSSVISRLLLKNKKLFRDNKVYDRSYLDTIDKNPLYSKLKTIKNRLQLKLDNFKLNHKITFNKYKLKTKDFIFNNKKLLKKILLLIRENVNNFLSFIKNDVIGKLHIYFARLFVISLIFLVPFIQLCTALFFNVPNKFLTHPITSYLFHYVPYLIQPLNIIMPVINSDSFSFLILIPYIHFFTFRFKRYKIGRKIASQGTLALMLMFYRQTLITGQQCLIAIYKFAKKAFILRKEQDRSLLLDDVAFFCQDLEDIRIWREIYMHLGESIFSVDDIINISKIWECTTIFAVIGLITLLYNCIYFTLTGENPYIPIFTTTSRRMMSDMGGPELDL
uniref:Uncharacterized protein n=1 Tax=Eustigmatophyceae sp. Ndem 8/9T-3m6.8 TaxID=2506146 RepID=A0A3R5U0N5_9STRA|nr:hypothetical protein Ycf60 [Eustigmatophyceae sp. Ndem 8/9T-3m6.8]QAA11829.1 hypothetical protein Ycf60 [Eustigmatophyceae sp. Ndem 8/9T-3m6.8]